MDTHRVVLAFNGHPASCAALRWLMDEHQADVVALVVDVGQMDDLEEVQARAVACGAIRAHVVDRCEAFASRSVRLLDHRSLGGGAQPDPLETMAHSVIAAALVEVAAIEGVRTVAHASTNESLDGHIRALAPALGVLAPAREMIASHVAVADYVKMRQLSAGVARIARHLLIRRASSTASGCEAASVTIGFEDGTAASVNGVSMGFTELIESLSLIGGRYGVGATDPLPAPALGLLQAAYAVSGGHGSVTLLVRDGSLAVAGPARAVGPAEAAHHEGADEAGRDEDRA